MTAPIEEINMNADKVNSAAPDKRVSRRWLLRSTASLTAGLVAVGKIDAIDSAASEAAPVDAARVDALVAPDHDTATGEIFDRDRHHHWDTV
ncbi:MAG TPA: hypothetical protein VGH34_15475 [Vicinamibacterales bacterium]|jgi:hypothetical protein